MEKIVLASGSQFRKAILMNAGLDIEVVPAQIDERAAEAPLQESGASPEDVALILAEAKAVEVSTRKPGALVLGCDQTMSLGDEVFHKPADMEGARRHLLKLSGKTHHLNSAAVLVRDGEVLWRHVGTASLTLRKLDPAFIGRHLARVGPKALLSVGAYQIEGEGIQLFEKIEGDYFTIVGVPLLATLAELRRLGAIDG
ncbi:septum formation inhibitor Maf [Mesorhizobium sp. Root554]|uniref:Maf-like protein n=1 Tax=unclassified Mesorhizobium TaxID=325217 RepID=UPI000700AEB7|nr:MULTISPECIES: Maf-like protein [unclassified Mesorhizobium]KQZ15071.1 septum formation inhibitor Maf [Mesorhizobium sp. Root1471]KQZ37580.1 septum formation inhibitor Maf [Mesorhizobium sp. Root554]